MNKKAIFLPFLAIFTLLILLILGTAIIIKNQDLTKQGKIGLEAISLFKIYDETEKVDFYILQSASYSKMDTLSRIKDNGGYPEKNQCQKTQDEYPIWNTCPKLNLEQNFKTQFKIRLQQYLNNYQSTHTIFAKSITKDKTTREILDQKEVTQIFTNKVKQSKIESLETKDNKIIGRLQTIFYHPEQTTRETTYYHTPKFIIDKPDFEIFDKLYLILSNCNSPDQCQTKLEQNFQDIYIETKENLIKIDYNDIHFAFDTSKPIQPKFNPLTV